MQGQCSAWAPSSEFHWPSLVTGIHDAGLSVGTLDAEAGGPADHPHWQQRARQGPRTLIGLVKPGRMRLAARGRGRIRPAAALEATDARKAGRPCADRGAGRRPLKPERSSWVRPPPGSAPTGVPPGDPCPLELKNRSPPLSCVAPDLVRAGINAGGTNDHVAASRNPRTVSQRAGMLSERGKIGSLQAVARISASSAVTLAASWPSWVALFGPLRCCVAVWKRSRPNPQTKD